MLEARPATHLAPVPATWNTPDLGRHQRVHCVPGQVRIDAYFKRQCTYGSLMDHGRDYNEPGEHHERDHRPLRWHAGRFDGYLGSPVVGLDEQPEP